MIEEVWVTIEECKYYEISNLGRVRHSRLKRILEPYVDNFGYRKVSLSRKGEKKIVRYVHRLMAIAFLDNPDKKTQVNHIDGNKSNYNIENLEWVDCSENTLHAFKLGLRKVPNEMKIKVFQHDIYVGSFNSQAAAARSVGVSSAYFSSMILKGVIKSKKGFSFEVIIND